MVGTIKSSNGFFQNLDVIKTTHTYLTRLVHGVVAISDLTGAQFQEIVTE